MRKYILLATVSLLSACGGGGSGGGGQVQAPGNVAPPVVQHSFVEPRDAKVYAGIGGVQTFDYATSDEYGSQRGQLYQGNATSARNSGISITYDPRDAIFEVKIQEPLGGASDTLRFQDPVHRTAFGGLREPQGGTPNLSQPGIQYLQAGSESGDGEYDPSQSDFIPVGENEYQTDTSTFFYQKPGTSTKYVTFAGFVRNRTNISQVTDDVTNDTYLVQNNILERAAFAYGERTTNSAVPKTGTGTYQGSMIATMVYNPSLDTNAGAPTYFQWLDGLATTRVNFAANSFEIDLTGKTTAPQFDVFTSRNFAIGANATFNASGKGYIDLVLAGGFLGSFQSASFTPAGGSKIDMVIAGSSVDGAFFGPGAEEVGGGFRIVGGNPDERIDILGTFVGKK